MSNFCYKDRIAVSKVRSHSRREHGLISFIVTVAASFLFSRLESHTYHLCEIHISPHEDV